MAHFHTAEGFPSAQERPDECVFNFQGTRGRFASHPSTAQKEGGILTPFLKNFLKSFLGNKKSACPPCFEVGQAQRNTPLRIHSVG